MVNGLILSNFMFAQNVDNNCKLIYIALKKFADNVTGVCFPSKKKLCELCNISMTTLNKGLKYLVEAGILKKEYRYRENSSQTSNKYTITPFMISGECYFGVRADLFELGLTVKEVLVYTYLCSVANMDGQCFPSLRTISVQCELGLSTVKVAIKLLLDKKLIEKQSQFRIDGGKRNNMYTVITNDSLCNNENTDIENVEELAIECDETVCNDRNTYVHEEHVKNVDNKYQNELFSHEQDEDNKDTVVYDINGNNLSYEINTNCNSTNDNTEELRCGYDICIDKQDTKCMRNDELKFRSDIFSFKLSKNAIMVYLYMRMKKDYQSLNKRDINDMCDITGLSMYEVKLSLAELDIKKLIHGTTTSNYNSAWPIITTPPQPHKNSP